LWFTEYRTVPKPGQETLADVKTLFQVSTQSIQSKTKAGVEEVYLATISITIFTGSKYIPNQIVLFITNK
jgi:hypothetical protein